MSGNNNSNQLVVPGARAALERMKQETAKELGIENYNGDLGDLPARIHGYVGGNMTRKLVKMAQEQLSK